MKCRVGLFLVLCWSVSLVMPAVGGRAQTFLISEVLPLPGHTASVATGVATDGTVVGYSFRSSVNQSEFAAIRGFRWVAGATTPIPLLPGKDGSIASGVNRSGEVVGYAFLLTGAGFASLQGFLDLPAARYGLSAGVHDLGHLGGGESAAYAINDEGNVVGESLNGAGYSHAFLWTSAPGIFPAAGMWDLSSLAGAFGTSNANAINNLNQVTGGSTTASGEYQAFIWCPTASAPYQAGLNNLSALHSLADSLGMGINEASVVVGYSYTSASNTTFRATFFDRGVVTGVSPLTGGNYGGANAINSYRQVAGSSDHATSATDGTKAVLISGGIQYDLGKLIGDGLGWKLQDALAINEHGEIAGYGTLAQPDGSTPTRGFRLRPNFTLGGLSGVPATIAAGQSVTTAAVSIDKAAGIAVVVKLTSTLASLRVPATVVIPAGSTSKTFTLSADSGSSGTGTVTATLYGASASVDVKIESSSLIATTLTVANVAGNPGATVSIKATLKAGTKGLAAKTIAFLVDGTAIGTATTSASGVATLLHKLTEAGGPHALKVEFAGDPTYRASSGTGTLTVKQQPSSLTVTSVTVVPGTTATLKGTLKSGSTLLAGRTVSFTIDGIDAGSAETDTSGVATLLHSVTETGGAHELRAIFAGDATYAPATSAAGTYTVKKIDTKTTSSPVSGKVGATVTLKGTVKAGTVAVSGATVAFTVDGVAAGSGVTDAAGLATKSYVMPEGVGTPHTLKASFAGSDSYNGSSGTAVVTTLVAATKITADVVKPAAGTQVAFGAKVVRTTDGSVLPGKSLSFYEGATLLGTATTDAIGRATLTVMAPAKGIKRTILAKFAGDTNYSASTATGSITGQ